MTYLRFTNWKRYQNADLAKKSDHRGLAWVKLWTRYDAELAALPQSTRLLFYELLRLAGREMNAIPNDMKWISGNTGLTVKQTTKGVEQLLKGAWLSETKTARNSRKNSRKTLESSLEQELEVEVEVENYKGLSIEDAGKVVAIRQAINDSLGAA